MDIVDEIEIVCPQCGEVFTIEVETTQPRLEMIEDCAVCCRPMTIQVRSEPGAVTDVIVMAA
jgi:hypothetical protein